MRRAAPLRHPWIPPVLLGVTLLAAWFIIAELELVSSYFIPHPVTVWDRLEAGLGSTGAIRSAALTTIGEAVAGCAVAAIIGIPLGYAIAKWRLFSATVEPYLAASQAVPAVAVAPILVLWIGYGAVSVVVLCTIIVIFPVVISTALGLRNLDTDILDAARLDGAGRWELLRYMELPLAAPSILAGLRTGFTLSVTGAIVGEMVMGGTGLGLLLNSSQGSSGNTAMLFAIIAVLCVLAVSLYLILAWLENVLNPLRPTKN